MKRAAQLTRVLGVPGAPSGTQTAQKGRMFTEEASMSGHDANGRSLTALRWIARIWGTTAVLLTAPFFFEHLTWFNDLNRLPPLHIFVQQAYHLLLLVGLIAAWRWNLAGGVLALLGGFGFFVAIGGGSRLLPIVSTITAPGVLFVLYAWLSHRVVHASAPA